jgi:hypothetical protein
VRSPTVAATAKTRENVSINGEVGGRLRLEIAGSLHRSQVCWTQDELVDMSEEWKAAIIENDWA